ncbi:hypothetical protein HDU97_010126 [Phlyctochytrium planicorne]|nr:hypothetical protein HDU97_010126 [Phlyctochytrium planicorne]
MQIEEGLDQVRWEHVIDVHSHLIDSPETLDRIDEIKSSTVIIMGTRVGDWEVLEKLTKVSSKAVIAFGIHPWFAHQVGTPGGEVSPTEWLQNMEARLVSNKDALVGEIGLDGIATYPNTNTKYDMDHQMYIFTQQFDLAARLQRCVSVHAVQCFGKVLDFLGPRAKRFPKKRRANQSTPELEAEQTMELKAWPPGIMLHSFSGSMDILKAIMQYPAPISSRFYFSFSTVVNGRSLQKTMEKIRAIPDDRILIESDLHDSEMVDDACLQACKMVAEAKGWSPRDAAEKTGANAREFLRKQVLD